MSISEIKDYIDIFKNLFTGLALVAAGGYFIHKVKSGYEVLNAKVAIETDRKPKPDTELDFLGISARFTKGDRGSLLLHDAQVRITTSSGAMKELPLVGVERLSATAVAEDGLSRNVVLWGSRNRTAPFLNMTPGEEATFAACCEIPRIESCTVEVVFLAGRMGSSRMGQWRASSVSLPRA